MIFSPIVRTRPEYTIDIDILVLGILQRRAIPGNRRPPHRHRRGELECPRKNRPRRPSARRRQDKARITMLENMT